MYKEIEELQAKLDGRDPASVDPEVINVEGEMPPRRMGGPIEEILPLPSATHFDDPNAPGLRRPSGGGVVGGAAPDYSGYQDIIDRMPRPKDTTMADLIAMGVSTGIGVLGGRFGTAANVAGDYGLARQASADKRNADFENQLLKLQAARAAKMATGKKGTKAPGEDGTKNRYIDRMGNQRTPQMLRQDGSWAQLDTDPVYSIPSTQNIQQNQADGSSKQNLVRGTQAQKIGGLNADTRVTQGPNGELIVANTRTGSASALHGLDGLDTQKTVAGVSPKVKTDLMKIQGDFEKDNGVQKLEQANADIMQMINALPTAGPENLLEIKRLLGIAMDKGRSLTNDEFAKVSDLDLGWLNKIEGLVQKGQTGEATNLVRQSYEKMGVSIEKAIRELYNKKVGRYNDRIKFVSGSEFKPELLYGYQTPPTAKKQMAASRAIEAKAADLSAGTTKTFEVVNKATGKKEQRLFRYNGETKKWDMVR